MSGYRGDKHTRSAISIPVYPEHTNGTLVTHSLFGDADYLFIVVAERNSFHSGRELPSVKAFSSLHRPQAHSVVCRARNKETRLCCIAAGTREGVD